MVPSRSLAVGGGGPAAGRALVGWSDVVRDHGLVYGGGGPSPYVNENGPTPYVTTHWTEGQSRGGAVDYGGFLKRCARLRSASSHPPPPPPSSLSLTSPGWRRREETSTASRRDGSLLVSVGEGRVASLPPVQVTARTSLSLEGQTCLGRGHLRTAARWRWRSGRGFLARTPSTRTR
jgi:hypothetical protein